MVISETGDDVLSNTDVSPITGKSNCYPIGDVKLNEKIFCRFEGAFASNLPENMQETVSNDNAKSVPIPLRLLSIEEAQPGSRMLECQFELDNNYIIQTSINTDSRVFKTVKPNEDKSSLSRIVVVGSLLLALELAIFIYFLV